MSREKSGNPPIAVTRAHELCVGVLVGRVFLRKFYHTRLCSVQAQAWLTQSHISVYHKDSFVLATINVKSPFFKWWKMPQSCASVMHSSVCLFGVALNLWWRVPLC